MTQFGKFCRILRIKNNEVLKDMADKLNVTSAYLSSIENGKRNIPNEWLDNISKLYNLSDFERQNLKQAIIETRKEITLRYQESDNEKKEFVLQLARKFDTLSPDEIKKISTILKGGD